MNAVWAAACCVGERDLVERSLRWLQEIAFAAVSFDTRGDLWLQAITAVRDLSDLDLADYAFDQLKLRLVENVAPGPFLAAACRQFVDAFTGLAMPVEGRRLLADCVRLARTTMDDVSMVGELALAAGNYARIGDIEACTSLLMELLQVIPRLEGDNIQANCLEDTLNGINALASIHPSGKGAGARLLEETTGIAQSIGLDEYALRTLAAIVRTAAAHDLAAPVNAMTERLRKVNEPWDNSLLNAILQVAWALHQAGKEEDVEQLLGKVEAVVEHLSREDDYEREVVCQGCTEIIAFCDAVGRLPRSARWHELAVTLAKQVQEPEVRTSVCANLTQIAARFEDAHSAGAWLNEAIEAWHRIEERFHAGPYIGDIYYAWAAIPDPEGRWDRLDSLQTVFHRIQDLGERDAWQARVARSFLGDRARFWNLMAPVVTKGGINILLFALYDTAMIPIGILPEALYDLLEKASRLSRIGFAGFGLLATQGGIRHRILDSKDAVPALATLEAVMREITAVDRMAI